ncbi:MAG: hypothetical protein AB1486_01590 [Planctomycetota bacterium]
MSAKPLELHWPRECFYWGVLDTGMLPSSRKPSREALDYLFEPFLPEPLQSVQAVYAPLGSRRYVACAVPRSLLQSKVPREAVVLSPENLADFVDGDVGPARLNLLTGAFTPPVVTAVKKRFRLEVALVIALAAFLVALGFETRIRQAEAGLESLQEARDRVYEQVLGRGFRQASLPPPLQLEAEWRRLRQTRTSDVSLVALPDVAVDLSKLLALWPSSIPFDVQSLQITADAIHLQTLLPRSEEAQIFASAFEKLSGWDHEPPSVHAAGNGFLTALRCTRREGGLQ